MQINRNNSSYRFTQPFAPLVFLLLRLCEKQPFTLEAQSQNVRRKGLSAFFQSTINGRTIY
jgi:hypothetical protein